MIFADRVDAGRTLATALQQYRGQPDAVVIALPRGGVVVGTEVARRLSIPLDIVVPRKIGAPGNEEFAIGALTETGAVVWNDEAVARTQPSEEYKRETIAAEWEEAKRRLMTYRGNRSPRELRGKTVLMVDDGIATGATMRAAIRTVRDEGASRIVLAVPVAAKDSLDTLRREVDEVVCLDAPEWFGAVGAFYESFAQTTDDEVIALLRHSSPSSSLRRSIGDRSNPDR